MAKNIILRPVYNRPEMLYLSLEYEKKAREHHEFSSDLTTIFVIEHGADEKTKQLVKEYPFDAKYIVREKKYGLSPNILEGMKVAFSMTDDYVIYIEDDILVHHTYFQYMDVLLHHPDISNYSVLQPFNPNDRGDVHEVRKFNHYAALAPLISKDFFGKYIAHFAEPFYYSSPGHTVVALNERYRDYWKKGYKYTDAMHYEQAGLINRLVDVAKIEGDMSLYMPSVNRQIHIGFYGKNRPGGKIPGKNFDERLENLREVVKDANKMYEMTAAKCYNDYKTFSPKLDDWDGTIKVV